MNFTICNHSTDRHLPFLAKYIKPKYDITDKIRVFTA